MSEEPSLRSSVARCLETVAEVLGSQYVLDDALLLEFFQAADLASVGKPSGPAESLVLAFKGFPGLLC